MAKAVKTDVSERRGYWNEQLAKSHTRYEMFHVSGDHVIDRYRLEAANTQKDKWQDRYNILFSTTETIKPSLYATTPKVQAVRRHKDRDNELVTLGAMLMETVTQYAIEEVDFDDVMDNVVEDYVLPGLGQAWVRYEPTFKSEYQDNGEIKRDAQGEPVEILEMDGLGLDYVHWKDFRTGPCRVWRECPWVARRVYFEKEKAAKRFGKDKANKLAYSHNASDKDSVKEDGSSKVNVQAEIWEIWDKTRGEVVWYSDDYADDLLDTKPDFLKIKNFFPCPKPLRAISNTRTMIPKSLYSQYKAQQEELDNLTKRIRFLTEALKVRGLFDGSNQSLVSLLQGEGNKMVAVENWSMFMGQGGGIAGSVQWVPIKDVAQVLSETLKMREVCKSEIYEITGFSDIQRGVSKASETLGAQQIKDNWASARLRKMQKEVQRFCRDLIRLMSEVVFEQFSTASLAVYAGFEPPPPTVEENAAAAQALQAGQPVPPTASQQAVDTFDKVVALLKQEKTRCASIGIETDSTIMPNEEKERADRMAFLAAIGAFLQQSGPMAMQYPEMRGLLGAIMMFSVRTFRASRPIELEFEEFAKKFAQMPAQDPNANGDSKSNEAAEQAKLQIAQGEQQSRVQMEQTASQERIQMATIKAQSDKYEADLKAATERERIAADQQYRMRELAIREREVAVKEAQLGIEAKTAEAEADLAADRLELDGEVAMTDAQRENDRLANEVAVSDYEATKEAEGEKSLDDD